MERARGTSTEFETLRFINQTSTNRSNGFGPPVSGIGIISSFNKVVNA